MSYDHVNWGPGPGSEAYPAQPWGFQDGGPPGGEADFHAFGVADAMWRMGEDQRRAAEASAHGAGTAAGPVIEPDWVGRPAADDPPALGMSARVHMPAVIGEGEFATGGSPQDVPFGERGLPSPPPSRTVHEPVSTRVWPEDQHRPGWGTVALATISVGGLVALAVATSGESNKAAENPHRPAAPPAAAAPAPEGYTCAITGVKEVSPYTGAVTLSATAGGRAVWVGNNVQADVAGPTDTTFTFDASNMHGQTITVSVGSTHCEGSFNLGQVGPGDETFRSK